MFEVEFDGKEVVVKFSRRTTVHRYLAGLNLASQLKRVEPLPGSWNATIMEKVDGLQLQPL